MVSEARYKILRSGVDLLLDMERAVSRYNDFANENYFPTVGLSLDGPDNRPIECFLPYADEQTAKKLQEYIGSKRMQE